MSGVGRSRVLTGRVVLAVLALLVLAVAVTAEGALAPVGAALDALVDRTGTDYAIAAVLGAIAVVVAVAVFVSGRGATMRQREMPTVERPIPAQAAGEDFDETIEAVRFGLPLVGRQARAAARDRLRRAAIDVVAATDGCSRRIAVDSVEDGDWTDDPVAAAFLAGEPATVGVWIAALTHGRTPAAYRAGRTVEAIAARHERRGESAIGGADGDG